MSVNINEAGLPFWGTNLWLGATFWKAQVSWITLYGAGKLHKTQQEQHDFNSLRPMTAFASLPEANWNVPSPRSHWLTKELVNSLNVVQRHRNAHTHTPCRQVNMWENKQQHTHSPTRSPLAVVCFWLTDLSRSWPALITRCYGTAPQKNTYMHTPLLFSPFKIISLHRFWGSVAVPPADAHTTWAAVILGWSCPSVLWFVCTCLCVLLHKGRECPSNAEHSQTFHFKPKNDHLTPSSAHTSIYSRLKANHSSINMLRHGGKEKQTNKKTHFLMGRGRRSDKNITSRFTNAFLWFRFAHQFLQHSTVAQKKKKN